MGDPKNIQKGHPVAKVRLNNFRLADRRGNLLDSLAPDLMRSLCDKTAFTTSGSGHSEAIVLQMRASRPFV